MLQFEKKLIITGAEQKVRKDGTLYTLIHVLGENGATFACVNYNLFRYIFLIIHILFYSFYFLIFFILLFSTSEL